MVAIYIYLLAILFVNSSNDLVNAVQKITFEDETDKYEEHYVNAKNMEIKLKQMS